MLLPDPPQKSPNNTDHAAILASLYEVVQELDALGCHLAAAHVSSAIDALSNAKND